MIPFLKSLDTYNRDLKLSTHNSEARGCFNLLLTIVFVALNLIYIFLGLKQPKLKRIEEMNYIDTELLNLEEMNFEIPIVVTEYYNNYGKEDFHLCDLYFDNYDPDTSIKFKIISEKIQDSTFIRNSEVLISYKAKDLHRFGNGYYNYFRRQCQMGSDDQILDSCVEINFDYNYINEGMLINRLNFDDDKSKKFLYEKSFQNFNKNSRNTYPSVNMKITLNSLYDDFKGLFDFSSELSSELKNKIKNNEKLDIKNEDYLFSSTVSQGETDYYKHTKNVVFYVQLELNKMSKIYIRNYYNFLYYIPMFFSVFISIMKSFNVINILITYHYRYFYFLNNNCNIKYDSTKTINSINMNFNHTHNNSNYIENSLKNNFTKDESKDLFDNNYEKVTNNSLNQNIPIVKNHDKSSRKPFIETEILFNDVSQDEDEDKNSDYILESNDLKYTKKDVLLFLIPFRCCRSNKTNIKLEILKDVKHKLNYDKSSFCYLTNSVTTYLIHNNIIKMF